MRELGVLESDAERLREAVELQRAALSIYEGKQFTIQRIYAEVELGRSLAALAKVENVAGEGLEEAIKLLSAARDRFAAGTISSPTA